MSEKEIIDKKIEVLYDRYKDRHYAVNAQKDVEQFRRQSYLLGMTTSALAFVGNEFIRLTMRSRKLVRKDHLLIALFKLKIQNILFWLIGPQLFFQAYYRSSINERIDNMWRIHSYRVEHGKSFWKLCFEWLQEWEEHILQRIYTWTKTKKAIKWYSRE